MGEDEPVAGFGRQQTTATESGRDRFGAQLAALLGLDDFLYPISWDHLAAEDRTAIASIYDPAHENERALILARAARLFYVDRREWDGERAYQSARYAAKNDEAELLRNRWISSAVFALLVASLLAMSGYGAYRLGRPIGASPLVEELTREVDRQRWQRCLRILLTSWIVCMIGILAVMASPVLPIDFWRNMPCQWTFLAIGGGLGLVVLGCLWPAYLVGRTQLARVIPVHRHLCWTLPVLPLTLLVWWGLVRRPWELLSMWPVSLYWNTFDGILRVRLLFLCLLLGVQCAWALFATATKGLFVPSSLRRRIGWLVVRLGLCGVPLTIVVAMGVVKSPRNREAFWEHVSALVGAEEEERRRVWGTHGGTGPGGLHRTVPETGTLAPDGVEGRRLRAVDSGAHRAQRSVGEVSFWLPEVLTDVDGAAVVRVPLPKTTSRQRLQVVALDEAGHLGWGTTVLAVSD